MHYEQALRVGLGKASIGLLTIGTDDGRNHTIILPFKTKDGSPLTPERESAMMFARASFQLTSKQPTAVFCKSLNDRTVVETSCMLSIPEMDMLTHSLEWARKTGFGLTFDSTGMTVMERASVALVMAEKNFGPNLTETEDIKKLRIAVEMEDMRIKMKYDAAEEKESKDIKPPVTIYDEAKVKPVYGVELGLSGFLSSIGGGTVLYNDHRANYLSAIPTYMKDNPHEKWVSQIDKMAALSSESVWQLVTQDEVIFASNLSSIALRKGWPEERLSEIAEDEKLLKQLISSGADAYTSLGIGTNESGSVNLNWYPKTPVGFLSLTDDTVAGAMALAGLDRSSLLSLIEKRVLSEETTTSIKEDNRIKTQKRL